MALENQAATGEVEEVITPEVVEQPKSMDDTIRETLRGLQDKGATVDDGDAPETPEEKADRIRDKAGKFAKEAPADAQAPTDPTAPVTPAEPVVAAPNTWKKEAAATWAALPDVARQEIARREADFHKGIEQYKQAAQFAQTVQQAIAPYQATLNSLGVTPDKAVSELMAADHRLRYGSPQEKNAYFAQLAQSYGIDLGQVQQPEQQNIDPTVAQLQSQVQQLTGWIQNQSLMGQQQQEATLNSEIASFAADPSHSHFESVRGHMSALLQAGQATSLKDAYEQAVWANPTTRAAVLQQQEAAKRAEATKTAQAAKQAASINVRSRPSMPVSQPIGSMDETIRATLRRLQSA